jgi:hypothetical protein
MQPIFRPSSYHGPPEYETGMLPSRPQHSDSDQSDRASYFGFTQSLGANATLEPNKATGWFPPPHDWRQ